MSISSILLLCSVVFLFYFLKMVVRIKLKRREFKRPPPPVYPGDLPIFGHTWNLIRTNKNLWTFIESVIEDVIKTKQDAVTIKLGIWTVHGIADPEDCHTVANVCLQRVPYGFAKFWLGDGLLTAPLHIWKNHRKLLNRALKQQVLDGCLSVFNKYSKRLVQSLERTAGGESFDPNPFIRTMTLDAICSAAMGCDEENLTDIKKSYINALHVGLDILMTRIATFWLHSEYIYSWTKYKRIQDDIYKAICILNDTVIKRRLEVSLKANSEDADSGDFKPFMDSLLNLWKEGGLSYKEIHDEVNTMVAAGYDTTASTTLLLYIAMGTYPEVQEKVYQEIQEVFEESDRDVGKYDLIKLKYMDAAIKETMRLYPIVPHVFRVLDKDVNLKHYTLPSGDTCCISIYAANRHPIWGLDADKFVPERWLEPSRVPAHLLATFSYGKRGCIGTNYAMMSMKTSLVHMLRSYRIEADITLIKFKVDILSTPISGYYIKLHKRKFKNIRGVTRGT